MAAPFLSHLMPPLPFSSSLPAPPLNPTSTRSALGMSSQSAAKSYKQALNYNKCMGALLSNGSDLRVMDTECVCLCTCQI